MPLFSSMLTNALLMSVLVFLFLLLRIPLQRRVKPGTLYAIGIIVAVGLLIPLRPALPISILPAPEPLQQMVAPEVALPETVPYYYDFGAEEHQQLLREAIVAREPVALDMVAAQPRGASLWRIAAIVWLGGAMLMAAYHTLRHLRFRHLIRRWNSEPNSLQRLAFEAAAQSVKRPPRLLQCDVVQSPMLVGLIRPIVLLPRKVFSADELAIILQHEFVHYTRRDLWCKALVLGAACLHWWNPLVHLLARAISSDCEMSCDDLVLAGADMKRRRQYGETILSAITRQTAPYAALSTYFYEGRSNMKRRFASMLNMRPRRAGVLLIVVCLGLTMVTGSVFAGENSAPAGIAQAISPTTGMLYPQGRDDAYRPVLVEISNSEEARPHHAMSLADIVYEYIYWGPEHTRYLALYNDYHPEMVGAIRSGKSSSMLLRDSWDCPIVFQGGRSADDPSGVYSYIDTQKIPAMMIFDGAYPEAHSEGVFSRITTREEPHNVMADVRTIAGERWPVDAAGEPYAPMLPPLRFADAPARGDAAAREIIVPYDEMEYLARYTYNATAGYYERWYSGEPQLDGLTGQRIIADNVIVLYAELSYYNDSRAQPVWQLSGEGRLDVFMEGTHISGSWRRGATDAAMEYLDAQGNALLLTPGKTFVQIVPQEMNIYVGA